MLLDIQMPLKNGFEVVTEVILLITLLKSFQKNIGQSIDCHNANYLNKVI